MLSYFKFFTHIIWVYPKARAGGYKTIFATGRVLKKNTGRRGSRNTDGLIWGGPWNKASTIRKDIETPPWALNRNNPLIPNERKVAKSYFCQRTYHAVRVAMLSYWIGYVDWHEREKGPSNTWVNKRLSQDHCCWVKKQFQKMQRTSPVLTHQIKMVCSANYFLV